MWKIIYIVTAWPLICVIEILGLIYRVTELTQERLVLMGLRWTKFCGVKVKKP